MRCYILFSLLLLFSCNDDKVKTAQHNIEIKEVTKNSIPQNKNIAVTSKDSFNIQKDSVIQFVFSKDSTALTAKGFITSYSDHVTGYLTVKNREDLTANLVPLTKGLNIRFTQIIMPDSSADGPFGDQLKYDLKQKGVYKIILAPNLMADGKTKGDFMINLKIEKK